MVIVTDSLNSVKLGTNVHDSKVQLMNLGEKQEEQEY
jgi:hypothetical protein